MYTVPLYQPLGLKGSLTNLLTVVGQCKKLLEAPQRQGSKLYTVVDLVLKSYWKQVVVSVWHGIDIHTETGKVG